MCGTNSHIVQDLQQDLNSTQDPGLNADELGSGSTQATSLPQDASKDDPFWDALNKHVLNLHGVISGHGRYLYRFRPRSLADYSCAHVL